jgi:excisionase family DNA binding protein
MLEHGSTVDGDVSRAVESNTWQRRAIPEQDYYTPQQAAYTLQISRRRVTQMLNDGLLQGEKLKNGRWRIPAAAVAVLVRERSRRPAALRGRPPVNDTIEFLENRISILENRLERQADALNRALNYAERMEEEWRSRIRELEEELNRRVH